MAVFLILGDSKFTLLYNLYIVAKCNFFIFVTWKIYKIFTKMWGVYSLLWDTVSHWLLTGHFIRYTLLVLGLTPLPSELP